MPCPCKQPQKKSKAKNHGELEPWWSCTQCNDCPKKIHQYLYQRNSAKPHVKRHGIDPEGGNWERTRNPTGIMEFCGNRKNGTTYAEGAFENQIRNRSPRKTDRKQLGDDGDDGDDGDNGDNGYNGDDGDDGDDGQEDNDKDDEDDAGIYPIGPLLRGAQRRAAGPEAGRSRASGLGRTEAAEAVAAFEKQSHIAQGPYAEFNTLSLSPEHYLGDQQYRYNDHQQHYGDRSYDHEGRQRYEEQQHDGDQNINPHEQYPNQQPIAERRVERDAPGETAQLDPALELQQKLQKATEAVRELLDGLAALQERS